MMLIINKDTKIYGSFSESPGNNGCFFFNEEFQKNNINAIYKSFYSNNIKNSVEAAKCLGFSGFAVSAPFKEDVLEYVDFVDEVAKTIGAANTVINNNGILTAYNTDWVGIFRYFIPYINWYKRYNKPITILGNGGFSKAVQYVFNLLEYNYNIITRDNWDSLEKIKGLVFNATPVDIEKNEFITLIDGRADKTDGKIIAKFQAEEQYKLYMKYAS